MPQIIRGQTVSEGWGGINAFQTLGVRPAQFTGQPQPSMGALTTTTGTPLDQGDDKPWHPDNPLFWFGLLLAATFGLVGVTTSARLGPFRAGAALGKS